MSAPHTVLELRTGRESEQSPETMGQVLAALPKIKSNLLDKLLRHNEALSFEIVVLNQTIYFLCYVPTRLVDYFSSLLQSSYPEILVTPLPHDPIHHFRLEVEDDFSYVDQQSKYLELGMLKLAKSSHISLKTYRDFTTIDPLASILATLSKSEPFDKLIIQISLSKPDKFGLKNLTTSTTSTDSPDTPPSKQGITLETTIRLAAASHHPERSLLLLENLAMGFQSITHSEQNELRLQRILWLKQRFLNLMYQRHHPFWSKQLLNIDELATIYHLPNKQLAHIPNIAWGKRLLGEPPEQLPIVTRDMDKDLKQDINVFARTTYKNSSVVYGLNRPDRRRHMYVIGKTGTGKSTLLANMAINDLKNNEGMAVIDPHGDLVDTLLDYIPSRRINDVVYFDPSDTERTVKINLFEGKNVEHRELIASGIVTIFHKLYAYSWGPRLEYILRNALLTLLTTDQSRMSDILDLLTNKKFRKKIVEDLDDQVLKNFWLYEFEKMPDRQRVDAIAPILNKVGQFVSSPLIRNVVNAPKSSFSIEDLMDQGKILLVNLSQGKLGEDNATLLGAMLITKIQLAAMGRVHIEEEERKDFYLYVDEFQNFATESFIKILSEARKYRLNLTLANQYIAQIPEEVQKAIFGNCGTLVSFVMGANDAEAFSKEFGDKYSREDLVSLGKYQIINKLTINNIISPPFPAHTLGLAKSTNKNRDKVIKVSRERYASKK